MMVDTAIDFLSGKLERHSQRKQDGRQYFIMHPALIDVVERRLERSAEDQ